MADYNNQKINPDPAILKVKQVKAQATPKVAKATGEVKHSPHGVDLPNLREIPEVRHSEPAMEIL